MPICDFILFSGLFLSIFLLFAWRYIRLFSISPLIYKTFALVTCVYVVAILRNPKVVFG